MRDKLNIKRIKDNFLQALIYMSTTLTLLVLFTIIGFVLYKGLPGVNINFLTRMWDNKTTIVKVEKQDEYGVVFETNEDKIYVKSIDKNSTFKNAVDLNGRSYPIKKGDIISKINTHGIKNMSVEDIDQILKDSNKDLKIKLVRPGGGIVPMLVSTVYLILLSLIISVPIGVASAIYLNEYAKRGRLLRVIRFAIQNLSGIPSIIYGLFGMLLFVQILKMQYSILAGALTLSIMLLPTIISTTEEALKAIPVAYRHSSLGLGATKLQTNFKVVLPNAMPGILVAIILSIGRIVGESAALLLTAGTIAQIPSALVGNSASAATLTTKLYWIIKESGDISTASSIAVILIILIVTLNIISKWISSYFLKKQKDK